MQRTISHGIISCEVLLPEIRKTRETLESCLDCHLSMWLCCCDDGCDRHSGESRYEKAETCATKAAFS